MGRCLYAVSYYGIEKNGVTKIGGCSIDASLKITTSAEYTEMRETLRRENKFEDLVITGITLLYEDFSFELPGPDIEEKSTRKKKEGQKKKPADIIENEKKRDVITGVSL